MIETLFPFGIRETMSMFVLVIGGFLLFAALLVPSALLGSSKQPYQVGYAVHCFLMKTIGLLLIAISLLALLLSVFTGSVMPLEAQYGPLFVLMVGVLLLVYFNRKVHQLDAAAIMVPKMIFLFGFRLAGCVLALIALLSMGLSVLQLRTIPNWEVPLTVLIIGGIAALGFTRVTDHELKSHNGWFVSMLKPKKTKK